MRTSNEVYRELELTIEMILIAKYVGEDINYIHELTIKRDNLRNEYNLLNAGPSADTSGQGQGSGPQG